MATISKTCRECGRKISLTLPAGELSRRWTERLSILCDECGDAAERKEKKRELAALQEKAVKYCMLPDRYRDLSFDEMDTSEGDRASVVDAAQRWAVDELSGLLLCGPTGTGKSRLAATALWARVMAGRHTRYISVARLIAMDRASFGSDEKAAATKILTGSSAIVLDDLDKVSESATVRSLLYLAIDNRCEAKTPLLVTTNLQPESIAEHFGEAISSRLRGECEVHILGGRDRRFDVDAELVA